MLTSPETLDAFIFSLNENSFECKAQDAMVDWRKWLEIYSERIRREKDAGVWEGDDFDSKREQAMKKANPRFILRQWVLEEIIKRVQDDSTTGKRALAKLHEVCSLRMYGILLIKNFYRWLPILLSHGVQRETNAQRRN